MHAKTKLGRRCGFSFYLFPVLIVGTKFFLVPVPVPPENWKILGTGTKKHVFQSKKTQGLKHLSLIKSYFRAKVVLLVEYV